MRATEALPETFVFTFCIRCRGRRAIFRGNIEIFIRGCDTRFVISLEDFVRTGRMIMNRRVSVENGLQDFSERDYSPDDFSLTRHAAVSLHEVLLAAEDGQAHE